MRKIFLLSSLQLFSIIAFSQTAPDASLMDRIKQEGGEKSQVMDIAFHLTDVSGPRLTASPNFMNAANWAKNTLISWGLKNATLEPWGEFGKGWQQERCYVAMTKPYYAPFIAIPRAWTGSTPGNKMINSSIVLIKAKDSTELMQYAGKLKNKIVMLWVDDKLKPSFDADAERFADSSLAKMASAEPRQNSGQRRQMSDEMRQQFMARQAMQRTLSNLYNTEKPALVLSINARGTDGTVFVQGGGDYKKDAAEGPANVTLSSDDYLRLQRLVNAGIPVELEADARLGGDAR